MSRQDDIKKLIFFHNRRLQMLEKKRILDEPNTSQTVLIEIDDIKSNITRLQSELEELEKVNVKKPSPKIGDLYYETKEAFSEFRQILNNLSTEIDYISKKAQARAIHLLEQTGQRFLELEKEWNVLNIQSEFTEETLKDLQSNLSLAKSNLNTLILRRNYRRRFSLLEEKLASQQLALTEEQLQTTLQSQLRQIHLPPKMRNC
jgi:hypothetical protein